MVDASTPLGLPGGFSVEDFQKNRGWFLLLGILLIIAGTLAIIYDVAATLISVRVFGWVLIFTGLYEAVQSFWQTKWGGFFLHLMGGVVAAVVGFHLLTSPAMGALVLTLVMGVYFLVMGIFRIVTAMVLRFPRWGWVRAPERRGRRHHGPPDQAAMAHVRALDHRSVHRHRPHLQRVVLCDAGPGGKKIAPPLSP